LSARLKLTHSYAGFLMLRGVSLLAVWVFVLRGLPDVAAIPGGVLNRSVPARNFAQAAAIVLVFLLVFGLVGAWILVGRMLAPLTRITDATRVDCAEELLERVWDESADPFTTTVKSTIDPLRAKLGEPPVIVTVPQGDYRI
jgi:two-component system sensor histidine kinase VanS